MGAVKAIATELFELNVNVDFKNPDDVFDLVVDMQLCNRKLSPFMVEVIWPYMGISSLERLWDSQEFLDAMAWHEKA